MLWAKESNNRNATYVDIFATNSRLLTGFYEKVRSKSENTTCKKSNETSLQKRIEGNKSFTKRRYEFALGEYNESLCSAENGSEHISLAYANRSACFLHMKKYRQCLVDIKLAKEAGYPTHLMPKLDKREAECMKFMENDGQKDDRIDDGMHLNFEPNPQFPCIANVLNFEKSHEGHVVVIAKENIDVGKTVIIEKAFTTCLYSPFGWRCNICLKDNANLRPCKKCNLAMFCSEECQNDPIHEDECGLKLSDTTQHNGIMMNEMRTMFKVVRMFPNVDELINFVEQVVRSDPKEIPSTWSDEKSKYRTFLKMPYPSAAVNSMDHKAFMFVIYKMLLKIPKISGFFKTKHHLRFLKHLIYQHGVIADSNSSRVRLSSIDPNPVNRRDVCSHIGLVGGYFQHSCAPNIFSTDKDGHLYCVTIRPVKKGEQLTTLSYDMLLSSKKERQQILRDEKHLTCKCSRCTDTPATQKQRKQLTSDPLYQHFKLNKGPEECIAVLRKYGHGPPWCDEIFFVMHMYTNYLRQKLLGNGNFYTLCSMLADCLNNANE